MGSRIPIFPLQTVLLPTTDLGIHAFEDRYRDLIGHSLSNGQTFGVVLDDHRFGTQAQISGYAMLPDGRYLLEVEGMQRFRVRRMHHDHSFPTADVTFLPEPIGNFAEARAASQDVSRLFHLYRAAYGDGDLPVHLPADPVARSYLVASLLRIDTPLKQRLLETDSAVERLLAEREILHRELAVLGHLRARR